MASIEVISLASSDDQMSDDYHIPKKKNVIKRKQRFITGHNAGLREVVQRSTDNDPVEGLLYSKRPDNKTKFFKDGNLKMLLESITLFKRIEGKKMAEKLLELYGKIPMTEWDKRLAKYEAKLKKMDEARDKKDKERENQRRKKRKLDEEEQPEKRKKSSVETDTLEETDPKKEWQFQDENRIRWSAQRKAAVDELRQRIKLRKKQWSREEIEKEMKESEKEDQTKLRELAKNGSKEAAQLLEAAPSLRQQSNAQVTVTIQRKAEDYPQNGEKVLKFCQRMYQDNLMSAWRRNRVQKELTQLLEDGRFKLRHVNGQPAILHQIKEGKKDLCGEFLIGRICSWHYLDEIEFEGTKEPPPAQRDPTPEITVVETENDLDKQQDESQFVTIRAGRTPPPLFVPQRSKSPSPQFMAHRAAHTPPPAHRDSMQTQLVEEYHLAKSKPNTFVDFNIFTECDETHLTCAKNATYGKSRTNTIERKSKNLSIAAHVLCLKQ